MDFRGMSCFLKNLSSCELVTLASILAISIAQELDVDDINVLGNFLTALGANLLTIAASKEQNSNN